MNQTKHEFKFSIIIPIYNVEEYIEDTINSIINQSLSFKENVQIILVNDGSPDNSEKKCLEFKNLYPNNIYYYKKENGGVSTARNFGMKFAEGAVVNFLDSDDILHENTLNSVWQMFEKEKQINLISLPVYYFEGKQGEHFLNYKYTDDQVIDIYDTPSNIQFHVSSSFIRFEKATMFSFDPEIKYGEDVEYVTKVILEDGKFGVLKSVPYYYRVRNSESSAMQLKSHDLNSFSQNIDNLVTKILNQSLNKFGEVIPYVQYVIMYELQWKFKTKSSLSTLPNKEDLIAFFDKVRKVLDYINPKVILDQRFVDLYIKLFIIQIKFNEPFEQLLKYEKSKQNINLKVLGHKVHDLSKERLYIDLVDINQNQLQIAGYINSPFQNEIKITANLGKKQFEIPIIKRPHKNVSSWGYTLNNAYGINLNLPIENLKKYKKLTFNIEVNGIKKKLKYSFTGKSRLKKSHQSYYAKDSLVLTGTKDDIVITRNTKKNLFKKECRRLAEIYQNVDLSTTIKRFSFNFLGLFYKKPIFLFMDRSHQADDNAEVLFNYANKQSDRVNKYFIISKDSPDYLKMKKRGKVVKYYSFKHQMLLTQATQVISSHFDNYLFNPYQDARTHFKDLLTFDYIFLQHGILKNDLSHWLNKFNKNIKRFIVSTEMERRVLLDDTYGYSENEIVLTGLPRFDRLFNDHVNNQILIMPTWRTTLRGEIMADGRVTYNRDFIESDYFNGYNNLINHPELIELLAKYNYKALFVLHPSLDSQIQDFQDNEYVQVVTSNQIQYHKEFKRSSLLITDYSSVEFDFAYLKKPIIYYQFDQDKFYSEHYSASYYNHQKHGFGSVVTDNEGLLSELENKFKNNFEFEHVYANRLNEFYYYNDHNNSYRVYAEMMKLLDN
ncbi:CDP-glycerol glycerophosphotransferase family protein [Alkalibacillus sp. S2W]|uniref:bifunctional glycosyltransferase/CDP-glycerol:glycerophosphate glycerophosphotransferase n=1 Tax=Alkalibacillus sp. S2W TaxID=3386553 RepID=UPI00398CB8A9